MSAAPPSSSALGRSPRNSAALPIPNTGTSRANGVTAAAVWRLSSVAQAAKPNSPLTSATKASAASPVASTEASASPISPGPSKSSDSPSSGSGGTRLAQTSIASGSGGCAMRVMTFVTPHAAAAARIRRKGRIGALAARSTPITASPAKAIPAPIICRRRGRSRSTTPAKAIVKITWSWSSSEESPTGRPRSRLTNSSPNFTTPSRKPNASTIFHARRGRPTRKIAGTAMSVKRRALNSSGGKWSRPTWMTTKFTPHSAATQTTRATDRAGMGHIVRRVGHQIQ